LVAGPERDFGDGVPVVHVFVGVIAAVDDVAGDDGAVWSFDANVFGFAHLD
jgi:hypothetical protein